MDENERRLLTGFNIKNYLYIERLKNEILYLNNQSEYFRLKYYSNMILKIEILKELLK